MTMKSIFSVWIYLSKKRKIQFMLVFFLMIVTSVAEVISIGAVIPFISIIAEPEKIFNLDLAQRFIAFFSASTPKEMLLPVTILFCLAAFLSGLMRVLLMYAETKLSHLVGADFSVEMFRKTLYQPYEYHVSRNSSHTIATITQKSNSLVMNTIFPVLRLAGSVVIVSAILVSLIIFNPVPIIIIILVVSSIYAFLLIFTKPSIKSHSKSVNINQDLVIKSLQEGLGGIRDVIIDGAQQVYCNKFKTAEIKLRNAKSSIQVVSLVPKYLIEAVGIIIIAILAYQSSISEGNLDTSLPFIAALAMAAQRILPLLQQGYHSLTNLRGGEAERMESLKLLAQTMPNSSSQNNVLPIVFNDLIELVDIDFEYGKERVLQNINLKIKKGSIIGLLGISGGGKSTILDILMGLLIPSSGLILIDGVELTRNHYDSWRSKIAHVPQNIFLSDSTIAENIAFGLNFKIIKKDWKNPIKIKNGSIIFFKEI